MKVAIVGAGKLGIKVANALLEGDHEITVIDISETVLSRISQQMDVMTVNASGSRCAMPCWHRGARCPV